MEKFTDNTLKALAEHLNKRYVDDNGYISGVIDEIDEWAYEHELENDVYVEAVYCRWDEPERGLFEWEVVDGISEDDYDNKYHIVDITFEGGGICVYCAHAMEEDF